MPESLVLHVRRRLGSEQDRALSLDTELVGDPAFIAEQVDILLADPCLVSFELMPRETVRMSPIRQTSE